MKHLIRATAVATAMIAVNPTVAVGQMAGQQAQMATASGLRDRPQPNAPVAVPLPAGTALQLKSRVTNSSGSWWFVTAPKRDGWVPESEINGVQTAPVAAAPSIQSSGVSSAAGATLYTPPPRPSQVEAQRPNKPIAFVFDLGFEFGGDDVATVFFTNGDSQDIEAGRGVTAGVGISWMPSNDTPVDIRATIGYKYTTTAADNADISMSRVMLAVVPTYRFDGGFWLAAGAERHISTKFDADGLTDNIEFDDATGFTLQAGYKAFAVRYLSIKYEGPFEGELDGSAVGLLMNFTFR